MILKILIMVAGGLALMALLGSGVGHAQETTADDVRAQFANITQAEVEAMGYVQESPCIDASELPAEALAQLNIPATAGMGVHFINEGLIDTTLDPLQPEAIQFGPDGEIWNVEYVTPPQEVPLQIFGQQLAFVEEADIDGLHLWIVDNPNGQFTDFNPAVTCTTGAPVTGVGPLSSSSSSLTMLPWSIAAALVGAMLLLGGFALRRRTA